MENRDLFAAEVPSGKQPAQKKLVRRSATINDALVHLHEPYSTINAARIGEEDILCYIYGLLYSEECHECYASSLSKQLPHIPRMKNYTDFSVSNRAGRDLTALYLNYETMPMYQGVKFSGGLQGLKLAPQRIIDGADEDFHVAKMKFAKRDNRTRIICNGKIAVENIPETAYDYIVDDKSIIEWVMERQAVTADKKPGITNNANNWAADTMHSPRYPLKLLLRVIAVSLGTRRIVYALPKLGIVRFKT